MRTFTVAPLIAYGESALQRLKAMGTKRVLIVTDAGMVQFGIADKITAELDLAGISWEIFSEVEPNPSIETVLSILKKMMAVSPDTIIGLGGGSPIDAAKGALYFATKLAAQLSAVAEAKKPYFVAIPTTSGTGSEVTSYSVLTDVKAKTKLALADDSMLPDLAILDPEMTKTLPKGVIADTGMDVLTHATEAFVSKERNAYTNALAKSAIQDVFKHLEANYNEPVVLVHRESMQNASCMAGIAFNNSSLGINHSLAHALGGRFHMAHGKVNAILMPYVIRFNGCKVRAAKNNDYSPLKYYQELAFSLGLPSDTPEMGTESYALAVEILKDKLGIPKSLKDYGIDETLFKEAVETLATQAMADICTPGNPVAVTHRQLVRLLETAYYGA